MNSLRGEVLGIVGGLGPLASAKFVRTVYRCTPWDREQDAPRVIMDSNPAFPDRTPAFLAGEDDTVLPLLEDVLNRLLDMGATRLLICCMTAHHLLPRLSAELRRKIVPVPEVIVAQPRHRTLPGALHQRDAPAGAPGAPAGLGGGRGPGRLSRRRRPGPRPK